MNRYDLERIRKLNERICDKSDEILELHERMTSSAVKYDTIGGSHGAPVNKLEMIECLIDLKNRRMDAMTDERSDLKGRANKEIRRVINGGPETEDPAIRAILRLYYLSKDPHTARCLTWDQVIRPVRKYHNIGRSKAFELRNLGVKRLESYHI